MQGHYDWGLTGLLFVAIFGPSALAFVLIRLGLRWLRRPRISPRAQAEIAMAKEVAAVDRAIEQLLAPILNPETNRHSELTQFPEGSPPRDRHQMPLEPPITLPRPPIGWGLLNLNRYREARSKAAAVWASRIGDGHGPSDPD